MCLVLLVQLEAQLYCGVGSITGLVILANNQNIKGACSKAFRRDEFGLDLNAIVDDEHSLVLSCAVLNNSHEIRFALGFSAVAGAAGAGADAGPGAVAAFADDGYIRFSAMAAAAAVVAVAASAYVV